MNDQRNPPRDMEGLGSLSSLPAGDKSESSSDGLNRHNSSSANDASGSADGSGSAMGGSSSDPDEVQSSGHGHQSSLPRGGGGGMIGGSDESKSSGSGIGTTSSGTGEGQNRASDSGTGAEGRSASDVGTTSAGAVSAVSVSVSGGPVNNSSATNFFWSTSNSSSSGASPAGSSSSLTSVKRHRPRKSGKKRRHDQALGKEDEEEEESNDQEELEEEEEEEGSNDQEEALPTSGAPSHSSSFSSVPSSSQASSLATSASTSVKKRKYQRRSESGHTSTESGGAPKQRVRTARSHDVLFGRGWGVVSHPGNITFRSFVSQRNDDYELALYRPEKTKIIREIFDRVRTLQPPGRFLEKTSSGGGGGGTGTAEDAEAEEYWVEADEGKALQKISQALRECRKKPRSGHGGGHHQGIQGHGQQQLLHDDGSTSLSTVARAAPSNPNANAAVRAPTGGSGLADTSRMHVDEMTQDQLQEEADRVMVAIGLKGARMPLPFAVKGEGGEEELHYI